MNPLRREPSRPDLPAVVRPLLVGSCIALLAGCASTSSSSAVLPQDEVRTALDTSAEAMAQGRYAAAQRVAESVLGTALERDDHQEALALAGRARLGRDHYRKAYRHFETLLQDYPYSNWVLEIEQEVYDLGLRYIRRKPWRVFGDLFSGRGFGVEVLRQFAVSYRSSERADDALFEIAEYHFGRGEYELAAAKYEMIRDEFPRSEWFDLAFYRVGLSYFHACRGAGYDDTFLHTARSELLRYLARGMEGHRAEAEQTLADVEEELAAAQLHIAEFYLVREQDRGARMHLANAVLAYPRTQSADRARELLEEHQWDVSVHSLESLERGRRSAR